MYESEIVRNMRRNNGVTVPIQVKELEGIHGYEVVSGIARCNAARELKHDTIRCDIMKLDGTVLQNQEVKLSLIR